MAMKCGNREMVDDNDDDQPNTESESIEPPMMGGESGRRRTKEEETVVGRQRSLSSFIHETLTATGWPQLIFSSRRRKCIDATYTNPVA